MMCLLILLIIFNLLIKFNLSLFRNQLISRDSEGNAVTQERGYHFFLHDVTSTDENRFSTFQPLKIGTGSDRRINTDDPLLGLEFATLISSEVDQKGNEVSNILYKVKTTPGYMILTFKNNNVTDTWTGDRIAVFNRLGGSHPYVQQHSSSTPSVNAYGDHYKEIGQQLLAQIEGGDDSAQFRVNRDSLPRRMIRLSHKFNQDMKAFDAATLSRISDRVHINAGGDRNIGVFGDFYIEKVTLRIFPAEMIAEYEMSEADPAPSSDNVWTLGVSLLNVNTFLG